MVNGLLTGTTPVAIVGLPNFIPYIRSGTVKALAVDSETRSALFPDVPTLGELGFPNFAPSRIFVKRASPISESIRFSTRRSTSRNISNNNAPMAPS